MHARCCASVCACLLAAEPLHTTINEWVHAALRRSFSQEALRQRDAAATEAAAERSALRRDLERVLRERGALDAMRRLVAGAVAQKREQR